MGLAKQVIDFWKQSYKESRQLFWIELVGTITSVIASLAMALGSPNPNMLFVFTFYLIGSVCLQYTTWQRQAAWLFVLMSWYTLMNLIGLYNLLGN